VAKTWEQLEQYQPIVLKLLGNSFKKQRVAHAYLFEGSKGTGKKDVSLLFAKTLFCLNIHEFKPCNNCNNCRRVDSRNHPDIHIIEPDGLSIKKWQIQALQEEFSKTGVESNRKLYIIEHADRMTANAANSLLKFLEEPSSQTVAILLTEQIHRILDTILSRCQILSFKPLQTNVISTVLDEQGISPAISALASQVTNNVDEAVLLGKDEWFGQSYSLVLQLYEMLNSRPLDALFLIQSQWLSHFKEKEQLDQSLSLLLLIYRDLLHVQIGEENNVVYIDKIVLLKQHALQTSGRRVTEQMAAILEAKRRLSTNMNPHLLMEQLVFKLQEGL
jgi:DNA polymerase III subunit delta'